MRRPAGRLTPILEDTVSNSVQYDVVARYRVRAEQAQRNTERLARQTERLERHQMLAERSSNRLRGALSVMVPAAAIAGAAKLLGIMKNLKQEAEDAQISIAGTFKTLSPTMSFNGAMSRAADLVERFRDAAITSPATSRDFEAAFTNAAPMLAGLGLSNKEITGSISRLVPAAVAFTGGDFNQAGRDFREVLDGRLNLDNRTFAPLRGRIMEEAGVKDQKSFAKAVKKDPAVAYKAVMKVLASMDDVNKAFGQSFTGLSSSLQEYFDRFMRQAGDELFGALKKDMQAAVSWLGQNEDKVRSVAQAVGGTLAKAFKIAAASAKFLVSNMQTLLVVSTALAGRKLYGMAGAALAGRGASMASGLSGLASATPYRNLAARAKGGVQRAGARAGRAGVAGAGVLGDLLFGRGGGMSRPLGATATGRHAVGLSRGGRVAATASSAWTVAGPLLGKLVAGIGVFAKVMLPAVIVLSMVIGTFRVFKDKTNEATVFFNESLGQLFDQFNALAGQFGGEGGFMPLMERFFDWMGTGVVGTLGLAVKAVERFVAAFTFMVAVIRGVALGFGRIMSVYETYGARAALNPELIGNAFVGGMREAMRDRERSRANAERKRYRDQENRKKKQEEETTKKRGASKVEVNVHQVIKTDADPDRIAFRVGEVVRDVSEKFPSAVGGLGDVRGI